MRRRGIVGLLAAIVGTMRAQESGTTTDAPLTIPETYSVTVDTDIEVRIDGRMFLLKRKDIARDLVDYEQHDPKR